MHVNAWSGVTLFIPKYKSQLQKPYFQKKKPVLKQLMNVIVHIY